MSFALNNLIGFGSAFDPINLTYVANAADTTNASSYTFSSQSFGGEDARRFVLVGLNARAAGAVTISSVTIGGVTATPLVTVTNSGGGDSSITAIYGSLVPTGTTGSVVVVASASLNRCNIGIWRLIANSMTPHATYSSTANNPSVSMNVPANGFAIGRAQSIGSSPTATWAGLTESFDTVTEATGNTGATGSFGAAQTGLTVSCTWTATSGLDAFVAASWGP